jgi:hypothetical protein
MTSRLRVLLRKTHNPEVAGSSPAAATKISAGSYDSAEISLIFRTFSLCSLLHFSSVPAPGGVFQLLSRWAWENEKTMPFYVVLGVLADVFRFQEKQFRFACCNARFLPHTVFHAAAHLLPPLAVLLIYTISSISLQIF